jgi:hypothetical protein
MDVSSAFGFLIDWQKKQKSFLIAQQFKQNTKGVWVCGCVCVGVFVTQYIQ